MTKQTKLLSSLCAFLLSTAVFAATPDFSVLNEVNSARGMPYNESGHPGAPEKMHKCMMEAWKAAQPTEAQNHQACENMMAVKAVIDQHKEAIHQSFHAMMAAWAKHPVSRDEVSKAEMSLHEQIVPIHEAALDAQVNTINLLSAEQRAAFNQGFIACIHGS